MTVDILHRVEISVDEEKQYIEKEQKILYNKIIDKYRELNKW